MMKAWAYAEGGQEKADPEVQHQTWEMLAPLCGHGQSQSPIDIVSSTALERDSLPHLSFNIAEGVDFSKNLSKGSFEALGKGFTMFGKEQYRFDSIQWHTPSENTIDGQHADLEAQFVHQLADPALLDTFHRLAIVALLYRLGDCNDELGHLWQDFPADQAGSGDAFAAVFNVTLVLSSAVSDGYYHWDGSLTTPPCTEGVEWYLLKRQTTICQDQLDQLQTFLASVHGVRFNNRVTQPLYHRTVAQTPGSATTEPPSSPPLPTGIMGLRGPGNIGGGDELGTHTEGRNLDVVVAAAVPIALVCFCTAILVAYYIKRRSTWALSNRAVAQPVAKMGNATPVEMRVNSQRELEQGIEFAAEGNPVPGREGTTV